MTYIRSHKVKVEILVAGRNVEAYIEPKENNLIEII